MSVSENQRRPHRDRADALIPQIARFDFTWGTPGDHQARLDALRSAMKRTNRNCAVMFEGMGREIVVLNRCGSAVNLPCCVQLCFSPKRRPTEPIVLKQGQSITLSCDRKAKASATLLPVSMLKTFDGHGLLSGTAIFVAQYLFAGSDTSSAYLTVQKVNGVTCECTVNNSCCLDGIHLTVHMSDEILASTPGARWFVVC